MFWRYKEEVMSLHSSRYWKHKMSMQAEMAAGTEVIARSLRTVGVVVSQVREMTSAGD